MKNHYEYYASYDYKTFIARLERSTHKYLFPHSLFEENDYLYRTVNEKRKKFSLFYRLVYNGQRRTMMKFYGKIAEGQDGIRIIGKFKIPYYYKMYMLTLPFISSLNAKSIWNMIIEFSWMSMLVLTMFYFFEKLTYALEKPYKANDTIKELEKILLGN